MLMLHYGTPRDARAREELAAALPGAQVSEHDETGVFEVVLEAARARARCAGERERRGSLPRGV